jgi:hypothetical protein
MLDSSGKDSLDRIGDWIDKALDWMGNHPLATIVLFILLFTGGCTVAIHVGIVTSQTKLMPY